MTKELVTSTLLDIRYSAATQEAAEGFMGLITNNVDNLHSWIEVKQRDVKYANGSQGPQYFEAEMALVVDSSKLSNCLNQLDSVKAGYVEDPDEVMTKVFADLTVEVRYNEHLGDGQVNGLLNYTHNMVQEHQSMIGSVDSQVAKLVKLIEIQTLRLDNLQTKYEMLQSYIHSYINVEGLVTLVREIAEEVNPDLLDDYAIVRIH